MNATRNEEWRPIPGFEGYEASDAGRIRSVDRTIVNGGKLHRLKGRVLKPQTGTLSGHLKVSLHGKSYFVHRLVLTAFVGAPNNNQECLHANGIADDNRLENLSWGTHRENMQDVSKHKVGNAGKTHCKSGHEFSPENTYNAPKGERVCRTCMRGYQRKYRLRNIKEGEGITC